MKSSSWRSCSIGDVVELQRGYDLPEYRRQPGRVPVIGSFGITGYHDAARAKGPGVTVGRSGASFGVVNFSEIDFWPHNAVLFVTDFKGNFPRFVYYLLKTINFKHLNSGSAQPSLNRNYVYTVRTQMCNNLTQRIIASILSAYDDLIRNNTRRIAILEEMAQALYREWFVRFRFPGHENVPLVPSPLGDIPEGWRVVALKQITTKIGSGATPRGGKESYKTSGISLIRSLNVYDYHFDPDQLALIDDDQAAQLDNVTVEKQDILLNITGASVARCCIVPFYLLPARVNQHVAIVRVNRAIADPFYVLNTINNDRYKKHLLALAQGGATREALTKRP